MNYSLDDYIFYLYYILAIIFLFFATKAILKNRYQKTKKHKSESIWYRFDN